MGTASSEIDELIHQIAQRDVGEGKAKDQYKTEPLLAKLKELNTELWIDTGELEVAQKVWRKEMTALTTNNTLANQVVQSGVMDSVIKETITRMKDVSQNLSREELILEIGFVLNCRIALRLVEAFHVKVSVELHPSVACDVNRSVAYARRYFRVCPEFFIIKIPLTPEGLLAVRKLRKENIPINFTLGFSARQNYLAARFANPDFVNVFLGRLNQVVSDNDLGSGDMVGEKVTLATQRAIREIRNTFPGVDTRLIGASIRSGDQVATLAGLDVLTIPPKALQDFLDSGRKPDSVRDNIGTDPEPGIDLDSMWGAKCSNLWEIPDAFRQAVDDLVSQPGVDDLSGGELSGFFEARNINLFHRFTQHDLDSMYESGKIPKIGAWSETIGLDDLMTQSALQSFRKDQDALDARIASFLK